MTVPLLTALDVRVLHIEGDDAVTWLQGQTTQDVHAITEGAGAYTLFVYPTGRVRADAYVSRRASGLDLVLESGLRDALYEVLERYVVMEDVTISRPPLAVLTLQDVEDEAILEGLDARPASRLGTRGFDVFVETDALEATRQTLLGRGAELTTTEAFEAERIARGIPRLGADFGEDTLPQEAGVAKRAVSFTKGCYIGQEPVVMLEHRGKPPKKLCVVHGAGPAPAVPASLTRDDTLVGKLTSATVTEDGFVGLALVKRTSALVGTTLSLETGSIAIDSLVGEPL